LLEERCFRTVDCTSNDLDRQQLFFNNQK
jgi:hypothetical protein